MSKRALSVRCGEMHVAVPDGWTKLAYLYHRGWELAKVTHTMPPGSYPFRGGTIVVDSPNSKSVFPAPSHPSRYPFKIPAGIFTEQAVPAPVAPLGTITEHERVVESRLRFIVWSVAAMALVSIVATASLILSLNWTVAN